MIKRIVKSFAWQAPFLVLACFWGLGTRGFAATYTTIDYPGATSTMIYGINNAGTMVGVYYINDATMNHGFQYRNGVFTEIDVPGASETVAAGINNNDEIVGQYADSTGYWHGFTLISGQYATVDLAGYQTFPTAVGDGGEIVGFCYDSTQTPHGCISVNGVFRRVDVPGSTSTITLGINFKQQVIVGVYSFQHGFQYANGKLTNIDFPGVTDTTAFGVNAGGVIVGNYPVGGSSLFTHGFVLYQGVYHTADYPGALSTSPINLNDKQIVVGWYTDTANLNHGYSLALK